jgi:hypothetical protein
MRPKPRKPPLRASDRVRAGLHRGTGHRPTARRTARRGLRHRDRRAWPRAPTAAGRCWRACSETSQPAKPWSWSASTVPSNSNRPCSENRPLSSRKVPPSQLRGRQHPLSFPPREALPATPSPEVNSLCQAFLTPTAASGQGPVTHRRWTIFSSCCLPAGGQSQHARPPDEPSLWEPEFVRFALPLSICLSSFPAP